MVSIRPRWLRSPRWLLCAAMGICLWLALGPGVACAWEPGLTWQTLDTPHFRVHFHDEEEGLARRAASKLEVIHGVMTEEIGWTPRRRTDVVLVDHTDSANGYASTIPNNAIVIFVTAPLDGSALDFYEDWLTAILVHEYTHILHIDTIAGLPAALRWIFGRLIMTNDVYPRWVVEGYAVYQETLNTLGGRARSSYSDMVLRMATLEDDPIPLGNAEGFQRDWPRGNVRYLWGGAFITWVSQTYGEDAWRAFSHRHARAINPLAFSWQARKVFGKSLYKLWDEWQAALAERYAQQQAEVEASGRVEGDVLIAAPGSVAAAAWDPTGQWIYYSQGSDVDEAAIYRMPAAGGAPEVVLEEHAPRTLSFSPDGRTLYFSDTAEYTLYTSYLDVWAWDVEGEQLRRLTRGARAHDPAVEPSGHRMLAVVNALQQNDLAWILPGGQVQRITDNHDFTQYGGPRFSPDGQLFAVSTWVQGGDRDIHVFDREGQHLGALTQDRAVDVDPSFSPDGRYLLFSSDRSGIPNLYAWDLATERLLRISNVVGGAFDPHVSPDATRILFRGYSARGYDLRIMAYDPASWVPVDPGVDLELREGWPEPTLAGAALKDEASESSWGPPRRYNPLPGLLPPRLLAPDVYIAESGFILGAYTYARDALDHHAYRVWANYRTDSQFVSYGLTYQLSRYRPVIAVGASTQAVFLGNLLGYPLPEGPGTTFQGYYPRDYAYYEVRSKASATVTWPIQGDRAAYAQYSVECREPLNPVPGIDSQGWDPNPFNCPSPVAETPAGYFDGGLPDRGSFAGLSLGWRFRRSRGYAYSISPEDGQSLSITGQLQTPWLGADYSRQIIALDWRGYQGMPWISRLGLHNHVIAWRLAAGAGLGDELGQKTFRLGGSFGTSSFVVVPPEFYALRGYPVGSDIGDRLIMGSLEYRFPLFYLDRGLGMLPIFFRGAAMTLFTDVGQAFDPVGLEAGLTDPAVWAEVASGLRAGSGAELRADAVVGYGLGLGIRVGYAVGWNGGYRGDLSSLYLQVGSSF